MADVLDQLDPDKDALGTIARRHFRAEAAHQPNATENRELFPPGRLYKLPEPSDPTRKGKR